MASFHKVSSKRVTKGFLLSAGSLFGTKLMSLGAQVILGFLFSTQTYGIFAAATAALVFASGMQNSGVSKLLIQQPKKFDELAPSYAGFALLLGLLGAILLLPVGAFLSWQNKMPSLAWVVLVASIGVPLASLYSVAIARYSVELRYEEKTVNSLLRDTTYYVILISSAYIGLNEFSVATASVVSVAALLPFVVRRLAVKIDIRNAIVNFWKIAKEIRWTIFSAYLFGLSQSGDYLVLGSILSPSELGVYFFGYMLIGNFGTLISLSISQTLMPALSNIREDVERLQGAVLRSSGIVVMLAGLLCIGFVGLGSHVIHFVWGGKWDASIFVAVTIALTFPARIMASLGAVVFEAQGQWRTRALFVLYDAIGLMTFAAAGGWFFGINGAAIAVAIHRGLTGLAAFPFSLTYIGYSYHQSAILTLKLIAPFFGVISLLVLSKSFYSSIDNWWLDVAMTGLALCIFIFGSREYIQQVLKILNKRK